MEMFIHFCFFDNLLVCYYLQTTLESERISKSILTILFEIVNKHVPCTI